MARRLALLCAALFLTAGGTAEAQRPPPFDARAILVANGATGEVLYERRANQRLAIASITKLMTALVTLDRARPGDVVTVAGSVTVVGESTANLRAGESLTVRDLLAAALVQSANDAAYALASHVGRGSVERFVRLMNRKARELGLANTRFVRPDGLDTPGHYSSARDLLKLARRAMAKPLIRKLVRLRSARIGGGRTLSTWNDLLGSFPGTIGVKTGHTTGAGWSQVAAARRPGLTVYAVLLGGPSRSQRNADLAELLTWGFEQYARVSLIDAGRTYATSAVPFSERRVPLVALEPARGLVRLGRPLEEEVTAPAMLAPPVALGQPVGEVCVTLRKGRICRALVAAEAVPAPSFRRRLGWYADRAVEHAGSMLEGVLGAIF